MGSVASILGAILSGFQLFIVLLPSDRIRKRLWLATVKLKTRKLRFKTEINKNEYRYWKTKYCLGELPLNQWVFHVMSKRLRHVYRKKKRKAEKIATLSQFQALVDVGMKKYREKEQIAVVLKELGEMHRLRKEPSKALRCFDVARELSNDVRITVSQAMALEEMGKRGEAQQLLEEAYSSESGRSNSFVIFTLALLYKKDIYKKLVEEGISNVECGKLQKAINLLEEYRERFIEKRMAFVVLLHLAQLYIIQKALESVTERQKRWEEKFEEVFQIVLILSKNPIGQLVAYNKIGITLNRIGEKAKALEYFDKAREICNNITIEQFNKRQQKKIEYNCNKSKRNLETLRVELTLQKKADPQGSAHGEK